MSEKIKIMHEKFGKKYEHKCKECSNFLSVTQGIVYKRCSCYGLSDSKETEWNEEYTACGLFNAYYKGKEIIDIVKCNPREKVIKGQIGFFSK